MGSFQAIYDRAAKRKGGEAALEELLADWTPPKSPKEIEKIPDHRWLAMMTKCIFQAGFSWKVIEAKWPGFEEAFEGFDPPRWAFAPDEDLDALAKDTRIVRNPQKINTVRGNAIFIGDLAKQYGSAGKAFAGWPMSDQIGLLDLMKTKASRMGGNSAQYFIRFMGLDSFILSRDVNAALIAEGIIDKPATSKSAMKAVQAAFNQWAEETGRSRVHLSRVLAMSAGDQSGIPGH